MHGREGGIHGNPEVATTKTSLPKRCLFYKKEGPGNRKNGTSDSKSLPQTPSHPHLQERITMGKSVGLEADVLCDNCRNCDYCNQTTAYTAEWNMRDHHRLSPAASNRLVLKECFNCNGHKQISA